MRDNKGRFIKGNRIGAIALLRWKKTHPVWNSGKKGLQISWNKGTKGIMKAWNKGKKGIRIGYKHSVETRRKISKSNSGEKNWKWKGGITLINKALRHSVEWRLWRESVFKRDNYECQICGTRGDYLHPNHIKKFADYPDLRFKINNGVTLCKNCHVSMVNNHELEWESYFNFNLMTRDLIENNNEPFVRKGGVL